VLLPGRPIPVAEYPSEGDGAPNVNESSIPGNSAGPTDVISVESQTTQAR
jgi:two-component system, OmpR family, sensor histidine kinase MprB